jgi:hypothetical protein
VSEADGLGVRRSSNEDDTAEPGIIRERQPPQGLFLLIHDASPRTGSAGFDASRTFHHRADPG